MNRTLLLLGIFMISPIASAEITLYACQEDQHVTLQDKPIEGCQNQQTFTYQSFKPSEQQSGLRDTEVQQLQAPNAHHSLQERRYQNVDERVGGALMIREFDRRSDLCTFYQGQIESSLIAIERRPVDHLEVRQASYGLERDHHQFQRYCGKSYPDLDSYINSLQHQFKPDRYRW